MTMIIRPTVTEKRGKVYLLLDMDFYIFMHSMII